MSVKIQLRRGTASEWVSANPTLLAGELGLETNTGRIKVGNGTSNWNSLGYSIIPTALAPTASLMPFAGSSAPSGWLLCAGQAVDRSTYADLFTAIGTTYGVGDGSTTFNVPDLRGRVPAGVDNIGGSDAGRLSLANTLGTTAGSQTVTLTEAQMPSHTHTQDAHTHTQNSHNHLQNSHNHLQDSHNHDQNPHGHTAGSNFARNDNITSTAGAASGTLRNVASQSEFGGLGATGVFSVSTDGTGGAGGGGLNNWNDRFTMQIPNHTHSIFVANSTATNQGATATNQATTATNQATTATNQNTTAVNQNTGGGQAHDNMQPTILLNYIIKT